MDESVSFATLGATGHGVTEHLSVPVCGSYWVMLYCAHTNYCSMATEVAGMSGMLLLRMSFLMPHLFSK